MIMLRCRHCAEPVIADDDLRRCVHQPTESVACTAGVTGLRAEPDLDGAVAEAIAALDDTYTLIDVDPHHDGLRPAQIAALLAAANPDESAEFATVLVAEGELLGQATEQILADLLGDALYRLLEAADRLEEIRAAIQQRNTTDLITALLQVSPWSLFRYDLQLEVPDYTMADPERRATTLQIARAAGLDLSHPDTAARIRALISQAPYGGGLCVLWSAHPTDALALAQPIGRNARGTEHTEPCGTITFTDAHLLVLDRCNGSGHAVPIPTITTQWAPRRVSLDDPTTGGGYSWTTIAGPVASTYAGDYTLTQPAPRCA